MNGYDEILKAFDLKFEDITLDERESLERMAMVYETQSQLSIEDVRKGLQECINDVMLKLAVEPEGTVNNIFLKGRMLNYVMLMGVLSGPQKARDELALYVERLKTIKKK